VYARSVTPVDVVVVSYNSRDNLRACVLPLATAEDIAVCVVDNASGDRSLDVVSDLGVRTIPSTVNGGFAYGCNLGWRSGMAPHVLFLNPDAVIEPGSVRVLSDALEADPGIGVVAPLIRDDDGSVALSQRRFPRATSTFAAAIFVHRLFPHAAWASETVQEAWRYETPASPDWVSGACLMTRRSLLEQIDGWDERFFLYCEDKDLCLRVRQAGFDVRYEPRAVASHLEGRSAPTGQTTAVLAESRLRYAEKHGGTAALGVERAGVALSAATHALVGRGGRAARRGHVRALRTSLRGL
jgi:N-acetylglucosaminyl-diphospho-decaprenol L-rhamnosyltransferase